MRKRSFRIPPPSRKKESNPYPKVSIVREQDPSLSATTCLLVAGALISIVICGRLLIGGSSSEPERNTERRTAPAATRAHAVEAPPPPLPETKPAPAPMFAPKLKEAKEEPRALALSEFVRLREASLEDADRSEKAGRFQEALDALDEAEKNGAASPEIESRRTRLRGLLSENNKVDEAFARAEQAASVGEHDRAIAALKGIEETARKIGRGADLDERLAASSSAKERAQKLARGASAIDRARASLDSGDLASARAEVEKARGDVPGSPELAQVETRLHDLEKLPGGMVYVSIRPDKGLYVRKGPVTNAEFKKWIDDTGRSGAAPWDGEYPVALASSPVRGVFLDAAKNFAAWRDERLPTDEEWPAIRKALHLADEGRLHAGVLVNGFVTVKTP